MFSRDLTTGNRPFLGNNDFLQSDPHWKDHILFYEYFHGDDGMYMYIYVYILFHEWNNWSNVFNLLLYHSLIGRKYNGSSCRYI